MVAKPLVGRFAWVGIAHPLWSRGPSASHPGAAAGCLSEFDGRFLFHVERQKRQRKKRVRQTLVAAAARQTAKKARPEKRAPPIRTQAQEDLIYALSAKSQSRASFGATRAV